MKVVLTIAGSDSSGGAGIQADLKTFEAFGVFGCSVVTVLTAQNTTGVTDIYEISPNFIKSQLKAVFDDFEVSAIKIGMLYSNEIIDLVREFIKNLNIPIVFDPVFISKAKSKLLSDDAIENMKSLIPLATISTPNIFEAKELFNFEPTTKEFEEELYKLSSCVIVKNNLQEINSYLRSFDTLYTNKEKITFSTPYIKSTNTHGTGCSFSSAIAANLALGKELQEAIEVSKNFIYLSIKNAPNIGKGKGPIAHKIGGKLCQIEKN